MVISSVSDLKNIIIPHIEKYPVYSSKQYSFLILKEIVQLLDNKQKFNKLDLAKIIKLAYHMNTVSNRKKDGEQKLLEFIGVGDIKREVIKPVIKDYPLEDQFIIGFIDGDGSFHISFAKNRKIQLGFHITQHSSSSELLGKVKERIGCGIIKKKSSTEIRYQIDNFNEIMENLIPFMDKYRLHTNKQQHYNIFKEVGEMIKENRHKSEVDFNKIIELAYNMNKEGKRRRLTKEEYLKECYDFSRRSKG